jgi:surfeit locus 1 family protein
VLFVSLGRWQWHRGEAKQVLWTAYERNDSTPAPDARIDFDTAERFKRVALAGHFDPDHQFLLDNRSHAGKPGYEVLTPFVLESGRRILVNRGWIPFDGFRDGFHVFRARSFDRRAGPTDELPTPGPPVAAHHRKRVMPGRS